MLAERFSKDVNSVEKINKNGKNKLTKKTEISISIRFKRREKKTLRRYQVNYYNVNYEINYGEQCYYIFSL